MTVQIKQTTTFTFSVPVGEITFNFAVAADDHKDACQKLIKQLETVIAEVKLISKPGPN